MSLARLIRHDDNQSDEAAINWYADRQPDKIWSQRQYVLSKPETSKVP